MVGRGVILYIDKTERVTMRKTNEINEEPTMLYRGFKMKEQYCILLCNTAQRRARQTLAGDDCTRMEMVQDKE